VALRTNPWCWLITPPPSRAKRPTAYSVSSAVHWCAIKTGAAGSVAGQGMLRYKALYEIEARIKTLPPEEKKRIRQAQALPLWHSFIEWALQTQIEGVRHAGTTDALAYLLKHADNLQTYCYDGRLPISNIASEHVAKTIAIARKNFMFKIKTINNVSRFMD